MAAASVIAPQTAAFATSGDIVVAAGSQVTVGIFFFLLTFTASNAILKRWRLAVGWGLLAIADLVTLGWLNLAAQIVAILAGESADPFCKRMVL